MTTKPKAKKFRIKRSRAIPAKPAESVSVGSAPTGAAQPHPTPNTGRQLKTDDGFGSEPFPGSAAAGKPEARKENPADVQAALDAIAAEGLTGRQLRMARRLAAKHGLAASSDFDAVRLLRAKGVDPFERSSLLELVVPEHKERDRTQGMPAQAAAIPPTPPLTAAQAAPKPATGQTLPQKIEPIKTPAPPGPPPDIAARRAEEISRMQADITRRRRRKLVQLFARLTAFVFLPTLLAAFYYGLIATPMYATQSEFVIQQADQPQSGLGGLFSGTGLATSQDSITVQGNLQSREAMLRLNEAEGFRDHFGADNIDILQRLPDDASNEDAYRTFKRRVKIGYDPTEGVIRMEVSAASPEKSAAFSQALIEFAEEEVDNQTQRIREDQMAGARESFDDSEAKMLAAQREVLDLQEQLGVLDPASETSGLMAQINNFEVQLAEKRLALQQLLDNTQPNQARVSGTQGDIDRLETLIADLRSQMTDSNAGATSLASISSRLSMAQVDLETRTMMMQEALQQLEGARIEANRQVRYLSVVVSPVPPDEPTYPRFFENTLLAFLILAGIYLLVSLTVSILREQVSS
ncbi:MAG: capsule biosynthesis protein [Pseudomonadota bacterium]